MDRITIGFAKAISFINKFTFSRLEYGFPGYGIILKSIKHPFIINIKKNKILFNPKIAVCYAKVINGSYSEPETHSFIKAAIKGIENVCFVDIGANFGMMVVDMAKEPNIEKVLAYEPHPECYKNCLDNVKLNHLSNVSIFKKALSAKKESVQFFINDDDPSQSTISKLDDGNNNLYLETSSLDAELDNISVPTVILTDTEGSELSVIKGGRKFIKRIKPLIVFEYNRVSKNFFSLSDIKEELGDQYKIYRLRSDGYIDDSFSRTWNCVAVHKESEFFENCLRLKR